MSRKKQGPKPTKIRHGLRLSVDIKHVDGRNRVVKAYKAIQEALNNSIGSPSPATDLLVSQICYKAVKLGMYCMTNLNDPGAEAVHFLPMSNSLRLDLQALAALTRGEGGRVPSIEEVIEAGRKANETENHDN